MLEKIIKTLNKLLLNESDLTEKEKQLIKKEVGFAINQTKIHIQRNRINKQDEPSAILSNIWRRTADSLYDIKNAQISELSNIFNRKSNYWANPSEYSRKKLRNLNMLLTQIEEKINNLC